MLVAQATWSAEAGGSQAQGLLGFTEKVFNISLDNLISETMSQNKNLLKDKGQGEELLCRIFHLFKSSIPTD